MSFPQVIDQIQNITDAFLQKKIEFKVQRIDEYISICNEEIQFFSHPYYTRNHSIEYNKLLDGIFSKPKPINENTISHFSKLWFRNYFKNIESLKTKSKIHFLQNHSFSNLKNKSVLFVGASPLLEDQISIIQKNQDKLFIISSDTSAYYLLKENIQIQLIASVDSGYGTIYHFRDEIIDRQIPILTWLGGSSFIFQNLFPLYLFFSTHPLDQILHHTIQNNNYIVLKNPSLNISGLVKSFCEIYGAKELILSGVGFTSVRYRTHCRGTGYENYIISRIDRKYNIEAYQPITYRTTVSNKNKIAFEYLMKNTENLNVVKIEDWDAHTNSEKFELPDPEKINFHHFKTMISQNSVLEEIARELYLDKNWMRRFLRYF